MNGSGVTARARAQPQGGLARCEQVLRALLSDGRDRSHRANALRGRAAAWGARYSRGGGRKSVEEAAEIVGIPENTVKTRMFYARKRLAELLKSEGIERGWP